MHINNKKRDFLNLGKGPTDSSDGTTLIAEKEYFKNFTKQQRIFCLNLYCNGLSNYIFVKVVEYITSKLKILKQMLIAPLNFAKVSKDFSVDNMIKSRLYGYVYHFSGDCDSTDVDYILDIQKHLMKKQQKIILRLNKQVFISLLSFSRSLAGMPNVSNFTTCITYVNNQPCMTRPTLVGLNTNKYDQGLRYFSFMVKSNKCNGRCNTLNDPSGKKCVVNET